MRPPGAMGSLREMAGKPRVAIGYVSAPKGSFGAQLRAHSSGHNLPVTNDGLEDRRSCPDRSSRSRMARNASPSVPEFRFVMFANDARGLVPSLHALDGPVRNPPVAGANSRALRTSTSSLEQQALRPASLR